MATTTKMDGVIYVERNYSCLDCDWTWSHVTTKGDKTPVGCPECSKQEQQRVMVISDHTPVKDKVVRGKGKPKSKIAPLKPGEFPSIQTVKSSHRKQAVEMAYSEMESRGFTNMADSAKEGDIYAPKLDNAVTRAMDMMKGTPGMSATGFTGDYKGGQVSTVAGETGGSAALDGLRSGLQNGQIADKLANTHRIYEPKAK